MQASKSLQNLAKKLFKQVNKFSGIVTTYVIKKYYPGFKASSKDHWEYLILKLLGRNKKGNKVVVKMEKQEKARSPQEQKLDSQIASEKFLNNKGLTRYGNPTFTGVTLNLKYTAINRNKLFKGSIGYNFMKECWYYTVGNCAPIFCSNQQDANARLGIAFYNATEASKSA